MLKFQISCFSNKNLICHLRSYLIIEQPSGSDFIEHEYFGQLVDLYILRLSLWQFFGLLFVHDIGARSPFFFFFFYTYFMLQRVMFLVVSGMVSD